MPDHTADNRIAQEFLKAMHEEVDRYAFQVPYDGSNKFYDEKAIKDFIAGAEWAYSHLRAAPTVETGGESLNDKLVLEQIERRERRDEAIPHDIVSFWDESTNTVIECPDHHKYDLWCYWMLRNGHPVYSIRIHKRIYTVGDSVKDRKIVSLFWKGGYWGFKDYRGWITWLPSEQEAEVWDKGDGYEYAPKSSPVLPVKEEEKGFCEIHKVPHFYCCPFCEIDKAMFEEDSHPSPALSIKEEEKIYIASKTKHWGAWKSLRDDVGLNIISSWIDEAGEGDSIDLADLCNRCISECQQADAVIVYREDDDYLKGAFIEMGIALAANKLIYLVGPVLPERSPFRAHKNVKQVPTIEAAIFLITGERIREKPYPAPIEQEKKVPYGGPAEGGAMFYPDEPPSAPTSTAREEVPEEMLQWIRKISSLFAIALRVNIEDNAAIQNAHSKGAIAMYHKMMSEMPATENPQASYWFEKSRQQLVDRNDFKAQLSRANDRITDLESQLAALKQPADDAEIIAAYNKLPPDKFFESTFEGFRQGYLAGIKTQS